MRTDSTSKEMRKITLKKGPTGFGIAISEDRFNRLIVRGLNPNGIAFKDGRMQVGDEIIAVNDMDVKTMKYDDVMNLLHQTQEPVRFHLTKPEILTTTGSVQSTATNSCNISNCPSGATSPSNQNARKRAQSQPAPLKNSAQTSTVTFNTNIQSEATEKEAQQTKQTVTTTSTYTSQANKQTNNDPKSNKIRVGEETLIEIERGKLGLGLSIVGGSDTQLPGIIIHDIYQSGAAYRDGRLAIGDQILKVNGVDLVNATHEQALSALRQTSDYVKLLIHRGFCPSFQVSELQQSATTSSSSPTYNQSSLNASNCVVLPDLNNINDEKFLNIMNVDLNKKFGKGLGFSIIGRRDGSGVFISHIVSLKHETFYKYLKRVCDFNL
jgi:C-terminal processing protease CtpA/Prc